MYRKAILSAAGILLAGMFAVTAVPGVSFAADTKKGTNTAASEEAEAGSAKDDDESKAAAEASKAEDAAGQKTETGAKTKKGKDEEITVHIGYEHDPMENPKAAQDIIVNHDAVYGYSPSPLSVRLREFVDIIDWTDEAQVEEARGKRIQYYETEEVLYQLIETMLDENKSTEEIARAVSKRRNELRLEAYIGDPDGLARVRKSNLDTYGNEEGPTIEFLYEKYGSWEAVLQKALSTNPGMDACLGLYDDYYGLYNIEEKVNLRTEDAAKTEAAAGDVTSYVVKEGDNLWNIARTVYGDGSKWKLIYEANEEILLDPAELKVGMKLVIPKLPESEKTEKAAEAETAAAGATK